MTTGLADFCRPRASCDPTVQVFVDVVYREVEWRNPPDDPEPRWNVRGLAVPAVVLVRVAGRLWGLYRPDEVVVTGELETHLGDASHPAFALQRLICVRLGPSNRLRPVGPKEVHAEGRTEIKIAYFHPPRDPVTTRYLVSRLVATDDAVLTAEERIELAAWMTAGTSPAGSK